MDKRRALVALVLATVLAGLLSGVFYVFTTEVFAVRVSSGIWWFALVLTLIVALAVAFAASSAFRSETRWQRYALLAVGVALVAAATVLGVMFRPFDPANIRLGALLGGDPLPAEDAAALPPAPLEISWQKQLPAVAQQGRCNSCWAHAAAAVLSARANMSTGWRSDDGHAVAEPACLGVLDAARVDRSGWRVSPQALVDLDSYQSASGTTVGKCAGSYAQQGLLLAARGVPGGACVPDFSAAGPSCAASCGAPVSSLGGQTVCTHANSFEWRSCPAAAAPGASASVRVRAGAAYRLTGEEAIRREIAARGPVLCLLNFYTKPNGALAGWTLADAPSLFGGAASVLASPAYIARPAADGADYTKSFAEGAHAVAVHGFGTAADGTRFWHIRNSWGSTWGSGGDAKVERGIDAWNIESYCFAAGVATPPP
jgi:hypothetical protein